LAALSGGQSVPVRVMVNRGGPENQGAQSMTEGPSSRDAVDLAPVRLERDPFDYRGTGGVLRDLAARYADDDLLLVANAAQVLTEPLAQIAVDLAATNGDVGLISHLDGTPSGLMLVRCAALRHLPASGFVDMKEQALPLIAERFDVTVVHRRKPSGLPVRTLDSYIEALRQYHQRLARGLAWHAPASAFDEDWEAAFSVVEEGARVEPSARLHDSVVLRGGRVEAKASVVHSVVCDGGVLGHGRIVVDQFVTPGDDRNRG
jgi:hypothetical protein